MKRVFYTRKQFQERIIDSEDDTIIKHIGPSMFVCNDDEGEWIAIIKEH